MATPDHAARRTALRSLLTERELDCALITDLINIRYLTGFTGSNAALLVGVGGDSAADTVFGTDGRYTTQSETEVPDLARVIERPCDLALLARARGRVGFESALVSVRSFEQYQDTGAHLTGTVDLVETLRSVKDAGEVELLGRACAVADQALSELIEAGGIRRGRTEREVGLDLDQRMRLLGADDPSFETIVAAGAHSAIPHHRPISAVLQSGDLVKFDFGAAVQGYHSDMTRTVVLGPPAGWQREIYDLVWRAQQAGRDAAVVGAVARQVDGAARKVIVDAGYGEQFSHGLGHGVGLQIHEAPNLGPLGTGTLESDMCVTVEPGVYLPGRGGVRIEDSGVVRGPGRQPGFEVLTKFSKELLEL